MTAQLRTQRFDKLPVTKVDWLWENRIPLGKITIIAGDPGAGKTWLTLDLAARVTTGAPFADDTHPSMGEVVFVSYEDGAADTLRPRLVGLGADLRKVHWLEGISDAKASRSFSLDEDQVHLELFLEQHPNVRMIVFDPISAATKAVSSQKVRSVMTPLTRLAEKHNVAIIGINHLSKGQGKTLYRALGSIAFVAAARSVWAVTTDELNPGRRLFAPVKCNVAETAALAYRVVNGQVVWERPEERRTLEKPSDEFYRRLAAGPPLWLGLLWFLFCLFLINSCANMVP